MEAETVAVDVGVETKSTKKGPHDKVRDIEMVESEVKTATNNWKKIRNNWKELVDKKTGKTYYHNKTTNKTSWELPQNAAAQKSNEIKNPSFEISNKSTNEISNKSTNKETKKETMSKKESPKTTLRRRRPTKIQNNRKIARKDSMEKRRKLDQKMAKQNDLDAADLADVNIDMRMKAVEDMYADGSANSADWKKAFCGKVRTQRRSDAKTDEIILTALTVYKCILFFLFFLFFPFLHFNVECMRILIPLLQT